MKGKFIALEGIDGCGKSTQAKLLAEWLRSKKYKVRVTSEPTDNPIGRVLKRALCDELTLTPRAEALLFAADRSIHIVESIKPAVRAGKIVITERYIHSSIAYQTVRGVPAEWIKVVNEPILEPDLVILIDVPVEVGIRRMNSYRKLDSFERSMELQNRVREKYKELAAGDERIKVVDGTKGINQTRAEIRKLVRQTLHADPCT